VADAREPAVARGRRWLAREEALIVRYEKALSEIACLPDESQIKPEIVTA
jgi:hypothetical protein